MDLVYMLYALVILFWAMIIAGITAVGMAIYGLVAMWRERKSEQR